MGHRHHSYWGKGGRGIPDTKPTLYYSVIVTDEATGTELARYTFSGKGARTQAREALRNVREVRINQNHERVTVTLSVMRG